MTTANDSVTTSTGSGTTIATHALSSKEHQAILLASGDDGHIYGSKPVYVAMIPEQVHVAVASTIHWDLYNSSTDLVRIVSIRQFTSITTAVTGVGFLWNLKNTSAVGTGGTTITPWLPDSNFAALAGGITCRSKPTGGATAGSTTYRAYTISSEETTIGNAYAYAQGGTELVPEFLRQPWDGARGILLRQNQGISCIQVTSSAAGNTGWVIVFTVG